MLMVIIGKDNDRNNDKTSGDNNNNYGKYHENDRNDTNDYKYNKI